MQVYSMRTLLKDKKAASFIAESSQCEPVFAATAEPIPADVLRRCQSVEPHLLADNHSSSSDTGGHPPKQSITPRIESLPNVVCKSANGQMFIVPLS